MTQSYSLKAGSITLGYKKSRNISQTRHFHEFYEILYIIDGVRDIFAGNRTVTLKKGDFLLIPPHLIHKSLENGKESEIYSLYLEKNEALRSTTEEGAVYFPSLSAPAVQTGIVLTRMDRELKEKSDFYQIMSESLAAEISVIIARHGDMKQDGKIEIRDNGKIESIIRFIENNYSENLNLKMLAEQFYISPSYLSRFFHRKTGFTLTEYINHIRALRAQKFLRETSEEIGQISRKCGFGSLSQFGRIFKSISGMTPRDYRKLTLVG
ncbi:helix-turn-helix transcriptional regulator [Spirochaeta isovalerica]|uniref:YesN/AraC family two-component response regulator n=1 Tax=Spirochaeta isovalerica TaxID=150 RepID=A0A841R7J6_9SPIO|nr:AraC family transcriptional regulator [Spirochaeta isovalerica]MBB6481234.1 YesN/AraC family two-component response regulator [Spirochaeta isovalerica]